MNHGYIAGGGGTVRVGADAAEAGRGECDGCCAIDDGWDRCMGGVARVTRWYRLGEHTKRGGRMKEVDA